MKSKKEAHGLKASKASKGTKTSKPKGLAPPGSSRPIRGNPDKLAATDTPIEVPVYIYYERHQKPKKPNALVGWTVTVCPFTFAHDVLIKIAHPSKRMQVVVDGTVLYETTAKRTKRAEPPHTLPRFEDQPRCRDSRSKNGKCAEVLDRPCIGPCVVGRKEPEVSDDDEFEEE